jgi:hypothetical protein
MHLIAMLFANGSNEINNCDHNTIYKINDQDGINRHKHAYLCIHTYVNTHIYKYMLYVYTYKLAYMYIYIYTHICVYICIYIYKLMCIYKHVYVYIPCFYLHLGAS